MLKVAIFNRISMLYTNGVPITNNVIYNTYRSGIVVTGQNNIIQTNLVTTVYWSGTAQSTSVAQYNTNHDGAIMSRDAISVIMQVFIRSTDLIFSINKVFFSSKE